MFVIGVHGSYCSYKTVRTFNELFLVERRLSFTVEVTTATGNWKHPLLLKITFCSVSNGYCGRNGWHLTPPKLHHARATKVRSHVLYIHIYIYISDFHYLDL